MLQLRDGRVLLTFTKRCNPDADPWYRPACRQDGHGTGLRGLLSKDGESWDWGKAVSYTHLTLPTILLV